MCVCVMWVYIIFGATLNYIYVILLNLFLLDTNFNKFIMN